MNAGTKVQRISIEEATRIHRVVFVDARTRVAVSRNPSRIRGAIHLPVKEVEERATLLPHDRTIVTYCT